MRALIVLALLGACTKEPGEGFPIHPGGGGGTGSSFVNDAAIPDPDGPTAITGRVCMLVDDPRMLNCAADGAAGLTVGLGTSSAVTLADGTFTLTPPANTMDLYWTVDGTNIKSSAQKMTATMLTLPVLAQSLYDDMVTATNANVSNGTGGILLRITRAGAVTGATVAAQLFPDSEVYYDGVEPGEWQTDATGTFGISWIPSIGPSDSVELTISSRGTHPVTTRAFADTLTFVFAEIP